MDAYTIVFLLPTSRSQCYYAMIIVVSERLFLPWDQPSFSCIQSVRQSVNPLLFLFKHDTTIIMRQYIYSEHWSVIHIDILSLLYSTSSYTCYDLLDNMHTTLPTYSSLYPPFLTTAMLKYFFFFLFLIYHPASFCILLLILTQISFSLSSLIVSQLLILFYERIFLFVYPGENVKNCDCNGVKLKWVSEVDSMG